MDELQIEKGIAERCKKLLEVSDLKEMYELLSAQNKKEIFDEVLKRVESYFDINFYSDNNTPMVAVNRRLENIIRNILEQMLLKEKLSSYPRTVHIEVTKRCNAACIMCGRVFLTTKDNGIYRENNLEYSDMPYSIFEKSISFLPYIETLALFGWGEPLLNPDFLGMMRIAEGYGVKTTFATNGALLNENFVENIDYYKCIHSIGISFDGAKKETFNRIRKGVDYDEVISNIRRIVLMKKSRNRIYPRLAFYVTAMKSNIEELPSLIRLSKELKIDIVHVSYLTVHGEIIRNESLFYHQGLANKLFREAEAIANEIGVALVLPEAFGIKKDDAGQKTLKERTCQDPWSFLMIDNAGGIKPCCYSTSSMGYVEKDLFSVWNNENFQKLRKSFKIKNISSQCLTCIKNSDVNTESTHIHIV